MPSLLVSNDFPPKLGGIQSYLYELWRRLPPAETTVLTTAYANAAAWDAAQEFRIERIKGKFMAPSFRLAERVNALAREVRADVIFVDPMLPLGAMSTRLDVPHVVVAHGAEITVPARMPLARETGRRVLREAAAVVAAGTYPSQQCARLAARPIPGIIVPPGVDVDRFHPFDREEMIATRLRFGLDQRPLVLGVSRLVPRKGFDVVIDAIAGIPDVQLAIAGGGRDRARLERAVRKAELEDRVSFLGRVPDRDLPALYAAADVFAMSCRDRWGGLEAEGFGIVFLEAAACGVPSVAGRSGGSHEAVVDGVTGFVVEPRDMLAVRDALIRLLEDDALRARMGVAARTRAVEEFAYDRLIGRLEPIARGDFSSCTPLPT